MTYKVVWSGCNFDVTQLIESAIHAESVEDAVWIIQHQRSRMFNFTPHRVQIHSVTPI